MSTGRSDHDAGDRGCPDKESADPAAPLCPPRLPPTVRPLDRTPPAAAWWHPHTPQRVSPPSIRTCGSTGSPSDTGPQHSVPSSPPSQPPHRACGHVSARLPWEPRRAGGEQDVRGVLRAYCSAAPIHFGRSRIGPTSQKLIPRIGSRYRRAARDHDGGQIRQLDTSVPEHCHVVGAQKVRHRDQDLGPTAHEDVGSFATLEPGVNGDKHGTGLEETQRRDDPLGTVESPDGDPIARLNSGHHQGGTEPPCLLHELLVGQAGFVVDERRPRPEAFGRGIDQCGDAAPPGGGGGGHCLDVTSPTFRRPARLPPMIRITDSPASPSDSFTSLAGSDGTSRQGRRSPGGGHAREGASHVPAPPWCALSFDAENEIIPCREYGCGSSSLIPLQLLFKAPGRDLSGAETARPPA